MGHAQLQLYVDLCWTCGEEPTGIESVPLVVLLGIPPRACPLICHFLLRTPNRDWVHRTEDKAARNPLHYRGPDEGRDSFDESTSGELSCEVFHTEWLGQCPCHLFRQVCQGRGHERLSADLLTLQCAQQSRERRGADGLKCSRLRLRLSLRRPAHWLCRRGTAHRRLLRPAHQHTGSGRMNDACVIVLAFRQHGLFFPAPALTCPCACPWVCSRDVVSTVRQIRNVT